MKIAVCEDNNIVAEYLEDYLSSLNVQNIEYEIFTSGDDLIHYMEQEKTSFNILFMDIEMPGRNGIDTSAYIRERDKNALIIFITDHQDYVYQVFEVLPFRFLIKPVQQEQLDQLNCEPDFAPYEHFASPAGPQKDNAGNYGYGIYAGANVLEPSLEGSVNSNVDVRSPNILMLVEDTSH